MAGRAWWGEMTGELILSLLQRVDVTPVKNSVGERPYAQGRVVWQAG